MAANQKAASGQPERQYPVYEAEQHDTTSFFFLKEDNKIRVKCRRIATSKFFEYLILVAILFNCVLMAINSPMPSEDVSSINVLVEKMELYLLGLFTVEMVLNIVHLGLVLHPGSYLRNPWNMLDFVVVVTGILSLPELNLIPGGGAMKALKAMRVLRPLKLVSGVPSLQVVMGSIANSLPPLVNVCVLVGFVIAIFAVVGLQMLRGKFHYTCFNIKTGNRILTEDNYLCDDKAGRKCPPGFKCDRYWSGPNDGITSFDNIFLSMLTVFVCITQEGWVDTMYWTFDVADENGYGFWIYYYILNVIGAQFMLNLVLGVLSGEFSKGGVRQKNKEEFFAQREAARAERETENYEEWIEKGEEVDKYIFFRFKITKFLMLPKASIYYLKYSKYI